MGTCTKIATKHGDMFVENVNRQKHGYMLSYTQQQNKSNRTSRKPSQASSHIPVRLAIGRVNSQEDA